MSGRGTQQSKNFYKTFYASLKAKTDTAPYFHTARREDADYMLTKLESRDEKDPRYVNYNERSFSGILIDAKLEEREYKNEKYNDVVITLRNHAAKEDYRIKAAIQTKLGRTMANLVMNLPSFDNVDISVYQKKDDGKPAISVKTGRGENDWHGYKIQYDDYKDLVRSYQGKGNKTEYDWSLVDNLFIKTFNSVMPEKLKELLKFSDVEIKGGAELGKVEKKAEEHTPDLLGQIREEKEFRKQQESEQGCFKQGAKETNDLPF